MMKRVRGVSIALFALLTVVLVCPAAAAKKPKAARAPKVRHEKVKAAPDSAKAQVLVLPGRASLGGSGGLSRFLADGDYVKSRDGTGTGRDVWSTRDAKMRFAFAAHFRYVVSNHWRWQVSPGFLWTGYKDHAKAPFETDYFPGDSLKGKYLTLVMPVNAQLQLMQRTRGWLLHEGVGGGLYRVWVEQDRHVVKDPYTKRLHTGFYPGLTAEIGGERFLKSLTTVSLEWSVASHLVFAQRDDQFVRGWNSNVWTAEARFGANYWFTPGATKKK